MQAQRRLRSGDAGSEADWAGGEDQGRPRGDWTMSARPDLDGHYEARGISDHQRPVSCLIQRGGHDASVGPLGYLGQTSGITASAHTPFVPCSQKRAFRQAGFCIPQTKHIREFG
jgi:hypothetical protein